MSQSVTRALRCNGNRNDVVIQALGKFCSVGFLLLEFGFALDEVMWKEHLFIYLFIIFAYAQKGSGSASSAPFTQLQIIFIKITLKQSAEQPLKNK